jgi:hypothetical protein
MNDNNQLALRRFVVGCINDNIWDRITAIVPLAGPSSLAGALVPLKGIAPTNFSFVAADYNIQKGLVGNGSTKYLNTGYASSTFGSQNDAHISCYSTSTSVPTNYFMGSATTFVAYTSGSLGYTTAAINNSNAAAFTSNSVSAGNMFIGSRRSDSQEFWMRTGSTEDRKGSSFSSAPTASAIHVFRSSASTTSYTAARLAFYSLGRSLNMGLLRNRMGTYVSELTLA